MTGEELKEKAKLLPLKAKELAKAMNISTGTLYDLYKRDDVEIKYLEKFSKASNIPLSELTENFKNQNNINELEFQKIKSENEKLKQENAEIKKKNSFLSQEMQGIKKELSDMKDRFINFQEMAFQEIALYKKKMDNVELGKGKASRKNAMLQNEGLDLFSLNFRQ